MLDTIKVNVVEFADRRFYQLRWLDPATGRKRTKSSGIDRAGGREARKKARQAARALETELRESGGILPTLPVLANVDETTECVYFIEAAGVNLIKIGTSKDIMRRFQDMTTDSAVSLRLLLAVPGGRREEENIHRAFWEYRSHGEWFFGVARLRKYIQRLRRHPRACVSLLDAAMDIHDRSNGNGKTTNP